MEVEVEEEGWRGERLHVAVAALCEVGVEEEGCNPALHQNRSYSMYIGGLS